MSALTLGRYSVACGAVGVGQACLEASRRYAAERRQFGRPLLDHQLVQRMLSDMITDVQAARLLARQAGSLLDAGDPRAVVETMVAKYFASRAAARCASDAVQIHGANGCGDSYPVARHFRDTKVMEIIEGSTEIQQAMIAQHWWPGP
jgi:alkylation response protein AidB-like acyl-CoA dehydrogenase